MNDAVIAGAVAGAVAGAICSIAIWLTSRAIPSRGARWQARSTRVDRADASTAAAQHREFGPNLPPPGPFTGGHRPFDRFNDRAKRVIALAQDEAIRFNHNYIGTEHLLLGLVRESEGVAGRVLERFGVELSKVRTAVEFIVGRGDSVTSPSEITLSPRTKRVLELAAHEATQMNHSHVGTEHLLLGLLIEGQGMASGVIESLGIRLESLRQAVLMEIVNGGAVPQQQTLIPNAPVGARAQGGPFDRFNDRAKRTLALAQDEAIRFHHNYMGVEHLLLGLIREGEGVAAQVLASLGADITRVRAGVEKIIGSGESTTSPSEITLTPRLKKVIELAIDESRLLGHSHIGTEHLLLGIAREGGSIATSVLAGLGIAPESIHAAVIRTLGAQQPPSDQPPTA